MLSPVDDPGLLDGILRGDEKSFAELVTRYHPTLIRVAGYYVGDRATAEDVAQDTWVAVMRGVDRFEGRSSFKTWLLRICANRARTRGTGDRRMVPVDLAAEPSVPGSRFNDAGMWSEPPTPFTDLVDGRLDDQVVAAAVRRAIADLPEPHQTVVTLRDVEGLSTAEVARLLELTEANVRVIVHRGRARLRAELEVVMKGGRS
jgi:RNA polymerase sigma-70 factor (ECF subfamily)